MSRINKFIASHSEFSRRKAEEFIQNGEVMINGKVVKNLSTQVCENDRVILRGKALNSTPPPIYIVINKPAGYVTTRSDEKNRKTVMDLLPDIPGIETVKPVGRLDMETEGLLILSNDGEFIHKHTHPRFEYNKTYFAIIKGKLDSKNQAKLENGIKIDEKMTSPAKIELLSKSPTETRLRITIHEGRNRQIRKMFDQINHSVKYLQRLESGGIKLDDLKLGDWRKLTKKEIDAS